MTRTYTVTVRGEVPADLAVRIAQAHAAAILASESTAAATTRDPNETPASPTKAGAGARGADGIRGES